MPTTPNPPPGNIPNPHTFVYPDPPDVLSEYPELAKVLMERITTHRHLDFDARVEAQKVRLKALRKEYEKAKNRKYAIPKYEQVSQNGDPKKGKLGFKLKGNPDPFKIVMTVLEADRAFCQWDTRSDRWIVYRVNATVPDTGGEPIYIETAQYAVVYFTWGETP